MARRADYAELVEQAEKAVASVNDPELKRAAFEKILEDLLAKHGERAKPAEARQKRGAGRSHEKMASRTRRGPQQYLTELVDDGFFKKPKTIAEVKAELENRGHHIPLSSL